MFPRKPRVVGITVEISRVQLRASSRGSNKILFPGKQIGGFQLQNVAEHGKVA